MSELPVITAATLARPGLRHGFTTRAGGVSEGVFGSLNLSPKWPEEAEQVAENYRRLARRAGFDRERLYLVTQVHGADGVRVADDGPEAVRPTPADYLYTDRPGATLAVITADCVPVLLAHPERAAVAAVHAGWRGLVAGVIEAAVASLGELGAPADELAAGLGPCIGPCCFEVGPEVAEAFAERFPDRPSLVVPAEEGPTDRPHVDLPRAAHAALEAAGLRPDRITGSPGCTMCDAARFFSYRRDGARIGQQLSFIGLE